MPGSGKILHLDQTFVVAPDETAAPQDTPCEPRDQSPASRPDDAEAVNKLLSILTESRGDAVSQLSGYLITEDPAYLPDVDDARAIARRIGRDRLLDVLIKSYIDTNIGIE